MSTPTRSVLDRFVRLAGDRLKGDWIIIGGTVLPLLGVEHRVTLDIDVVGPDGADLAQVLVLMEIAEQLGLPPESINQAGSFFLRRLEGWRNHVVVYHQGSTARILLPNATLFVLLKLPRLTESDLADCLEMLRLVRPLAENLDVGRIRGEAHRLLEEGISEFKQARLETLLEALNLLVAESKS